VRHLVVAVAVLMSVLLYLDRYCVSFAERFIKEDLSLTETQTALFLSLFFWSYALGQVPCGWLGDRFGVRAVLALEILIWSLFTALIGVAGGILSLLVMRVGCGLAQAGAYPASGNLLSKWVPLSSRGLASALVALGGRVGGTIAPPLTAYLMVVFVPLSTPALLAPDAIFRPEALARKLAPADGAAADGAAVKSAANGALLRARALIPEDRRPQILRAGNSPPEDQALRESLAALLNAIIERPDAFGPDDLAGLASMEREAIQLLERRARGESLPGAQAQRMNRLILEAIFPGEIGKLYVRGWRPVVILYGLAGILVAGIFWFCFRGTPAEHPRCNAAERALIEAGKPIELPRDNAPTTAAAGALRAEGLPLAVIVRSGSLWLSSISQFTTNVGWLFLVTFLARYLVDVHSVPILERSWMAAVPPFAGIAGMLLGGRITDWLTARLGLRWGRALPMAVTRFFAAGAYVACLWLETPWGATIAFACVFFSVDLGVAATWAFMQDVGGRHVGSILGWGNMWGNLGAAIAPAAYNAVLGEQPDLARWNTMFLVCAGMFVVSGIAAMGIDATVPIQPEPATAD
jgi:MFS family permease